MIIVMSRDAGKKQIEHVIDRIKELGYTPHPIYGEKKTVIGAIGDERGKFRLESLASVPGVEAVMPILTPYKLVGRDLKTEPTIIRIGPRNLLIYFCRKYARSGMESRLATRIMPRAR